MDADNQKRVLWDGVYLGVRFEDDDTIQLYSLGTFYVEVYYSPTSNEILRVQPFKSIKALEPYLTQITIETL
jgi:acid phosphatase class B